LRNLKDIRKRIVSVKGTQKLTRAMKLVSGAKLRRAQDNLFKLRPYAEKTLEAASRVAARIESDHHPLLARREEKRVILLVVTSDKGMCGSFNANVLRAAQACMADERACGHEPRLAVIGKKGTAFCKARRIPVAKDFPGFYDGASFEKATDIADWFVHEFSAARADSVRLVYNQFKTAASQTVIVEEVLPLPKAVLEAQWSEVDFTFEPNEAALLDHLLAVYTATEVWRAVLESIASEHGARMSAMENATQKADEMIRTLTLEYNKARQASITKELLEIVAGAEAQRAG